MYYFPALLRFHAPEEWTWNGVVTYPLILPLVSLFRPGLPFFLQELLLDVPLLAGKPNPPICSA